MVSLGWKTKKAESESDHSSLDPRSRMCGVVFHLRCLRHFAGLLPARVVLPQLYICTFAALIKKQNYADPRAHEFAHSPDLLRHRSLPNVSCVWSWRVCGINRAMPFYALKSHTICKIWDFQSSVFEVSCCVDYDAVSMVSKKGVVVRGRRCHVPLRSRELPT